MNTPATDTTAGAKSPKTNRDAHLSKDGKWRSFPKVPGLLQYASTGTYFARTKVKGKLFRQSLETDVFTTAKLRLPDKIKEFRRPAAEAGTFKDARLLYLADLENDHTLAPESKRYRETRIAALLKSWPGLDDMKIVRISEAACREWARRFAAQFDEQNFNNTLGSFRGVLERGGLRQDDNPAYRIKRLGVKPTELELPEPEQFERLIVTIETSGAGQAHDCADFARFLAFSGCRIAEARKVTWADVDFERGEIQVWNGKRSKKSSHSLTRQVPIIPPMRELLTRLQQEKIPQPTDRVCVLGECEKSLTRACEIVGIPRLTHHDLRHLFASVCIESGIDIPTVSRWLGHVDGGALAMRVYGHLRRGHSVAMAQKVTFGKPAPENVVPMPKQGVA
jgi:integrase